MDFSLGEDQQSIADLAKQLGDAGFKDWAIETAIEGAERAKQAPSRWRALLAASVAYVDHLDAVPALDYAERALAACEIAGTTTCPSWEQIRMELYRRHLDAGVKSGIDPRRDPKGFRRAGESGLRQIRLKSGEPDGGNPRTPPAPTPAPAAPK